MNDRPISIHCPYCRRFTALAFALMKHCDEDIGKECYWERGRDDKWWIGLCNACHMPVLVKNGGDKIYPHPLPEPSDRRIPDEIRNDLDEAKICFSVNAYRACAVMARRAMQSTCIDKGAKKERLADQIGELMEMGVITKDIKDWADVVRWVGNDAAHPSKKDDFGKKDSEDVLELATQLLHVIYITPAIAKARRDIIGK
jgi:hypothetical protein